MRSKNLRRKVKHQHVHDLAVRLIRSRGDRLGVKQPLGTDRFDIRLPDGRTVLVRASVASRPRNAPNRYPKWHFSFHTHGRRSLHADLWVLVAVDLAADQVHVFVVPKSRIGRRRLTLQVQARPQLRLHWVWAYEDRTDLLAARARSAATVATKSQRSEFLKSLAEE